jgi:hypothetical protein
MLFKDKLNFNAQKLQQEFSLLLDTLFKVQSHNGDLLLTYENGFYNPEVHEWGNLEEKFSPYVIGLSQEGHSANLHYDFIHKYRTNAIVPFTHVEYLKNIEWSEEKQKDIDTLIEYESYTIQLEMLIYLKIWESDTFIKRFYQIAKLINGEPYDWHFRIQESNRDKSATGKREEIIRKKIRDTFQNQFPNIYEAFKLSYKTQIRNSIAHSKYSFLGRNIHLNNYVKEDPYAPLHGLTFDEWVDIFHSTMIIYSEYIGLFEEVNKVYGKNAKLHNNIIQVRINREDPSVFTEYWYLLYTEFSDDLNSWSWLKKDEAKQLGII